MNLTQSQRFRLAGGALLLALGCNPSQDDDLADIRLAEVVEPEEASQDEEDEDLTGSGEPDEGAPASLAALSWVGSEVSEAGTLQFVVLPAATLTNETDVSVAFRRRWYVSTSPNAQWSEFEEVAPGESAAFSPDAAFYAGVAAHPSYPAMVRLSVQLESEDGRTQTLIADDFFVQAGAPLVAMGRQHYSEVVAPQLSPTNEDSLYAGTRPVSVAPASAKQASLEVYEAVRAEAAYAAEEEQEE